MNNLTPSEFYLSQNYPNPFSEKTVIKFCVPYQTRVELEVFDAEGKLIKKLLEEEIEAGTYVVEFEASQFYSKVKGSLQISKQDLTEEKYYYKLKAADYLSEKEMIISKKI